MNVLNKFNHLKENNQLEVKSAKSGLPNSLWETYSSFSNTHGGTIVLGVAERENKSLYSVGLTEVEVLNLQKIFWDIINNPKKVSSNLLSDKNVKVEQMDSSYILVIDIPEASRYEKPIYINDNPLLAYRRNFEGDYKVTRLELSNMLRDADINSPDSYIVENKDMSCFCEKSIATYRNYFESYKEKEHPFNDDTDEEFLIHIGVAEKGIDGKVHPTKAGLLMFNYHHEIVNVFPNYFLDYQDKRNLVGDMTWRNRVWSSNGNWSGNLFDFYYRVIYNLHEDLPVPFQLDGIQRLDTTPMHRAVSEALCNTLANADFNNTSGLVIKQYEDRLYFTNPGALAMPLDKAITGGRSDARNKVILSMFNHIRIGERSGSGIPRIFGATLEAGYPKPILSDRFNPDITELTVFIKKEKISPTTSTKLVDSNLTEQEQIIVDYIKQYGFIRRIVVEDILEVKTSRSAELLKNLVDKNILLTQGKTKTLKYKLK
ncbi:MAG: putative DNA binding domain-containing protein [Anaeroplasma bactoclasticum]|nr:putative DNA binding domain-containing protein [Anaeroplasma bactoclasticum]